MSKSVQLIWDINTAPTESYKLYRNTADDFATATLVATIANTIQIYNDYGLTPDTQYFYWMTRVLEGGESAPGASVAVTTLPTPVLAPTVRDIQDAIQDIVSDVMDLDPEKVIWNDQSGSRPMKPFIVLELVGPLKGAEIQWREQAGEALGDLQRFKVTAQIFTEVPDQGATITEAFQLAVNLRAQLDAPSVRQAMRDAGIGIGEVQDVQNFSGLLETKFERRAMLEFSINVKTTFPITTGYTIDTVSAPTGTVTP